MPLKNLLVGISLLLALIAGLVAYMATNKAPDVTSPQTAMLFPDTRELPKLNLLDHDGNAVGRDVFKGHWNLVFFGFTNCPDVCPATLTVLSDAKRQLQEKGHALPRIVLVSVDPERDTPDKLRQYIRYFGEDNLGLTGDLGEIRKLTSAIGVFFQKVAADGDNYSVDHSAVVMIIDPAGRQFGLFSSPHTASNFVTDMPGIMASHTSEPKAPLVASNIIVMETMPGMNMTAGYLTLTNNTGDDIHVSHVTSPQFSAVELHETIIEDDVARMREIPELVVPANGSVSLERGGKHMMLMRPKETSDRVTLQVWSGDAMLLSIETPYTTR